MALAEPTIPNSATPAENSSRIEPAIIITERDIIFDCPHCKCELVVDQEGAGMALVCSHCAQPITVPQHSSVRPPAPAPAAPAKESAAAAVPVRAFDFDSFTPEEVRKRAAELQLQLKENQSQSTEIRGHINRATIELHRFQLKLQKLQERQAAIELDLRAAKAALEKQS